MAEKRKKPGTFATAVILLVLLALIFLGRGFFSTATTIHQLLTENKQLKQAITNLTVEEKEYKIVGDIIHFDALIIKFGDQMVMDGRQKSLYLWRRIYSENIAPENGLLIEQPGTEPQRYAEFFELLPEKQRNMFWTSIWKLAHNPEMLKEYDIEAVYGNVLYSKLRPGYIYFFKISPSGQLYPQIKPDL
ncbi:MAG: hypothetical protein ACYS5F_03250 [Planctomycetota bacterium]|jgi:hypothetical protein